MDRRLLTGTLVTSVGLWAAVCVEAAAVAPEPTTSPYLDTVKQSCDVLLENAVDRYGEQKTGMILSVLHRRTGKPVSDPNLPKAPEGVRYGDRTVAGGSNANVQQDLYRVLQHLARLTGEPRYADAAHLALVDFLRTTQHPETGLLAWGEHLSWNCLKDRLGDDIDKNRTHEPKRKFLFFDELYEAEPERTLNYARGLWEHQVGDKKTGDFSRHAKYDRHDPRTGADFAKEASYFISTWSQAYAKTKDPYFDNAVKVMAQRFLDLMSDRSLLGMDSSGKPGRSDKAVPLWMISLANESHDAAPRMPPGTALLLQKLAQRCDQGVLALDHQPADPAKGFVFYANTETGELYPDEKKQTDGHSRSWGLGYGVHSTSMFATLANTRQAQLGPGPRGDAYRKLIVEAADLYRQVKPDGKEADIWAGEYGLAIFTELAAYRLTEERLYLDAAREIANLAIRDLWDDGEAPLPKASSKTDYYDVISYPDTTMLALLALHEHLANPGPPLVPISDISR